jgi:putative PIN family toxin of toxin-antitoxin system
MIKRRPICVIESNVFLRALINPYSRCGRLLDEFVDDYELVLSPAIIRKVLEVLHRPRLRAKFLQITKLDIMHIIALFEQARVVEPQDVPSVSRDPADDKFLACTQLARAEYLVTEDKGLLVFRSVRRQSNLPASRIHRAAVSPQSAGK